MERQLMQVQFIPSKEGDFQIGLGLAFKDHGISCKFYKILISIYIGMCKEESEGGETQKNPHHDSQFELSVRL